MRVKSRIVAASADSEFSVPDQQTVTSQVLQLARALQADFLENIRDTGLTPAQANTLRELYMGSVISQQELAKRLGIGKAATGEALHKLEQKGLVHRQRGETNKKLVNVELTSAGERVLALVAVEAWKQIDFLTDKLGSEDVEDLCRLLRRANGVFGQNIVKSKVR